MILQFGEVVLIRGRVPPTPEARYAPANSAGTHRCCRLPPQEGCRPLVHPLRARCRRVGAVRTTGLCQKEVGLTADVLENRLHKILDTTPDFACSFTRRWARKSVRHWSCSTRATTISWPRPSPHNRGTPNTIL